MGDVTTVKRISFISEGVRCRFCGSGRITINEIEGEI